MAEDIFTRRHPPHRRALKVALVYLGVSAVWIVFSDAAVNRLVADPETTFWQTIKGLTFVVASSVLLYVLVRREVERAWEGTGRLRALVEQSLAGIYLIRRGRFLYVNPALADVFGYAPGELTGDVAVADLVSGPDRETVLENLAAREEGRMEEIQYRFTGVRKDGEEVRVEVHGRRVTWEGEPAVLGVLLEVGERERLERQVREAQRLKALGELTGQIAHDFNNFLTGIIGPLDLCLPQLPEGGEARRDVHQARTTALRAASLSRKLLSFSRKRPTLARPVDLNAVLRDMEPLMGRLVGARVALVLELDPEGCTVMIDPTDAEQVVMNLVLNAAEAIESAGTVTIRTAREGGPRAPRRAEGHAGGRRMIRLEVEDDGVGIPEETLEWIFDPFFTTKENGTGLGLSTVFGIVSQIGGSVDVETGETGTRFAAYLPEAPGEAIASAAEPGTEPLELRGDETVLLLDDDDVVREVTRRALERFGYRVLSAPDGETALALAGGGNDFDLLLSDIQLPDMVGPDVAERVTAIRPGVAVVFMSGFSNREVIDRLSTDPSARLVQKPFRIEELLGTVRSVLDAVGTGGGGAT